MQRAEGPQGLEAGGGLEKGRGVEADSDLDEVEMGRERRE